MKVKLFNSYCTIWDLEKTVNDWLKENEDRIVVNDIKFSTSAFDHCNIYSILITYEDLNDEN